MRIVSLICLLGMLFLAIPTHAQDDANDGVTNSRIAPTRLAVNVAGTNIDVYFYKPQKAGKYPLLILSHGSPAKAEARRKLGAATFRKQAEAFVKDGVAVAVPIRRGYGNQGGAWAENYGGCKTKDYYDAGLASADDIRAVMASFSQMPEIDASRIVLVGQSAGGWASLAAGSQGGVLGVINFAGGRGATCPNSDASLVQAVAHYGQTSAAPELWIYSENDKFFGPALARQMHGAFVSAGGNATFVSAPAYSDDGHKYIKDIASWMPVVDSFLAKIGFFK